MAEHPLNESMTNNKPHVVNVAVNRHIRQHHNGEPADRPDYPGQVLGIVDEMKIGYH
jgi:hypothetical protein